jgi:hypothetical protein
MLDSVKKSNRGRGRAVAKTIGITLGLYMSSQLVVAMILELFRINTPQLAVSRPGVIQLAYIASGVVTISIIYVLLRKSVISRSALLIKRPTLRDA